MLRRPMVELWDSGDVGRESVTCMHFDEALGTVMRALRFEECAR